MAKKLQLKISLDGTNPPIWRRFLVDDSSTFDELHEIIQTVMGWDDYHLYQFNVGNTAIEPKGDGRLYIDAMFKSATEALPADRTKLHELIKENTQFGYLYDLGDRWEHTIAAEEIMEKDDSRTYPVCIGGERACPPEDCGGIYGYEKLLEILKNKDPPKHKKRMEWLGGEFDPEYFDLEEINEMLEEFVEEEDDEEDPTNSLETDAKELTEDFFSNGWQQANYNLKVKSKKDIAREMYFLGSLDALRSIQGKVKKILEEDDTVEEDEHNKYWEMSDDEKYEYLLTCEEEPDCEFSNFGMELEKKGEFEKAKKLYKREAELYPEDFSGYENLGRLYAKMKKFDLAEHNLKNALDLALQQKEENPDCIDDKVIDEIRKNLEEVKNAKH